jgi:DNA-binding transcriptional LysR family regulator
MDTDILTLFADVARRGSFAAVARERAIAPSLVSRAVAQLEAELGVRLLQRSTRRMALTDAGARYLARIEPLIEDLARARDEAQEASAEPTGTLRLTASITLGQMRLVPLMPELRRRFPRLTFDLIFDDTPFDLVAERIDLAIRLGPAPRQDVVAVKLSDTRYRVCASPDYLARVGAPERPEDLRAHSCVLFSLPAFRRAWLFRDAEGRVTEVPIAGDVMVSTLLGVHPCAVAGLGPALLSRWLTDQDVAAGRLVDLFPAYEAAGSDFAMAAWLLYPNRSYLPNKVRQVADFLRRALR